MLDSDAFHAARRAAVAALLDRRTAAGHWIGRLSSSALSTATAINALRLVDSSVHAARIEAGVQWLVATQLADGSGPHRTARDPELCAFDGTFPQACKRIGRPHKACACTGKASNSADFPPSPLARFRLCPICR
jgi:hypothetical protein